MSGERKGLWDEHEINGQVWIPAASHLTMIAAAHVHGRQETVRAVEMRDVVVQRPAVVREDMRVMCVVDREGRAEVQVEAEDGSRETCAAASQSGMVTPALPATSLEQLRERCTQAIDVDSAYGAFEALGVKFGRTFRSVKEAWRAENEAVARIGIARPLIAWERSLCLVHPAVLDAAFQLAGMCTLGTAGVCVPFHVDRAVLSTQSEQEPEMWTHVALRQTTPSSVTFDVTLMSMSGQVVGLLEGVTSRRLANSETSPLECLYETEWFLVASQTDSGEAHDSQDSTDSPRRLFISSEPLSADALPNYLNVVHVDKLAEDKRIVEHARPGHVEVDLKQEMPQILAQEQWASIVMVLDGKDASLLSLELVLLLIKEVTKLIESGRRKGLQVWLVSSGQAQACVAGVWALARTARIELPEIELRCVQLAEKAVSREQVEKICRSTLEHAGECEFFLDCKHLLYVRRLTRMKQAIGDPLAIRPQRTYVVSGGLGALGRALTNWLVASGATHVLLLTRSRAAQLPAELRAADACIECIECDVTSLESVKAARRYLADSLRWPEIAGVFHAAGLLSDATLRSLDLPALLKAYAPKVNGAIHLHDLFAPSDLFVLFSSAAATFGSPGQANYAAANAAMDSLADAWHRKGENVLSIQWGAWSEGGMAANEATLRRAQLQGFAGISNRLGLSILEHLLHSRKMGVVCATPIDWSRVSSPSNFLLGLKPASSASVAAKGPQSAALDAHQLKQVLVRVAKEVLNTDHLDEDTSLVELGLDSLGAVEFRNRLSSVLNMQLPSIFVYNFPSIALMMDHFLSSSDSHIASPLHVPNENIAIVGIACRFPGQVSTPEEFWSMLLAGKDCVSDIPISRFDIDDVHDPTHTLPSTTYTKRAALISNAEFFDHEFFSISAAEAHIMDPQQRILLEICYEAFSNAGYNKSRLKGSNTGIYVGQANYDWLTMNQHDINSPYFGAGSSAAITSNRLSYTLGLCGPSLTVDTACSSSLVAIDIASGHLKSGKCSLALVAGVNMILSEVNFVGSCSANMLSRRDRCATFDEAADGYCRGEGAGCVVLKRLSQAQADGDQILAVVRGTAVNQDGKSASMTAPSGVAQERVVKQALEEAGLSGEDVDYVECHGTGTKLGDPIEVDALKKVVGVNRKRPVVLGAVKTNIGHLEGAAGIAGLIKAIQVLRHKKVPKNLHFSKLNSKIDIDGYKIKFPTEIVELDSEFTFEQAEGKKVLFFTEHIYLFE